MHSIATSLPFRRCRTSSFAFLTRSTPRHFSTTPPSLLPRPTPPIPQAFFSSTTSELPPSPPESSSSFTSINPSEIAHFSRLSSQWWDEKGEFALLHRMNGPRMEFVREKIERGRMDDKGWSWKQRIHGDGSSEENGSKAGRGRWLEGMNVLDVGCGGGLLTESLSRVGANALGIDASPSNIAIATLHASQDPLLPFIPEASSIEGNSFDRSELLQTALSSHSSTTLPAASDTKSSPSLRYRAIPAEDLISSSASTYDLVCSMEVLEHVSSPGQFLSTLGSLVKPGGHLILSTINRTILSQFLTITMAENVLRLVTPGTHTYSQYIKPEEIIEFVMKQMGGREVWESDGTDVKGVGEVRGIVYDPLKGEWRLWEEGRAGGGLCNYMFHMRKKRV